MSADERRVTCKCDALEADPVLRRVGPRGGVTVTCPRREYCWDCHTELSLDAAGNAVVEAMVPRAALEWLARQMTPMQTCPRQTTHFTAPKGCTRDRAGGPDACNVSTGCWLRAALAAAGGGDGERPDGPG